MRVEPTRIATVMSRYQGSSVRLLIGLAKRKPRDDLAPCSRSVFREVCARLVASGVVPVGSRRSMASASVTSPILFATTYDSVGYRGSLGYSSPAERKASRGSTSLRAPT